MLHDLFAVPFDEIATDRRPLPGRRPAAGQPGPPAGPGRRPDARRRPGRQRAVVDAFLAAARGGDFDALLALLDPDVVAATPTRPPSRPEPTPRSAAPRAVAGPFSGRARVARPALVDGAVGAVWSVGGKARVVFDFPVQGGRVTGIDLVADPERLGRLAITPGDDAAAPPIGHHGG